MELILFPAAREKRPRDEISSQACNACKKRKGKCIGNPCEYCSKKGITCEFVDGKRRGPAKKKIFPKGIREFENVYDSLLSTLQKSMNEEYHVQTYVDIYFQYFGHPIPRECKSLLLSAKNEPGDRELTTQLYIISAHVMKYLGNNIIEAQCIAEANRHVSNIFNCDSLASAISLIMMALYLGEKNPKAFFFAITAQNIAKMVMDLKPSSMAQRICGVAKYLKVEFDQSLTSTQKSCLMRDMLDTGGATNRMRTMINVANVSTMLTIGANFDCTTVETALASISLPCNLPEEMKANILRVLALVEEGSKGDDIEPQFQLFLSFLIDYLKFIVEWRSSNMQEACMRLNSAMAIFYTNRTLISLWLQSYNSLPILLTAPYFYQQFGALDKMQESLRFLEEYAANIGKKEEFTTMCGAFRLPTTTPYSIAQIEQELLGHSLISEINEITNSQFELSDLFPL